MSTTLPTDSAKRKDYPIYSGPLRYFPAAIAAVARVCKIGNEKHNPGLPLQHDRAKSTDHADCIMRHLIDMAENAGREVVVRDLDDEPTGDLWEDCGVPQVAYIAWRALALCQKWLEDHEGAPVAPGATNTLTAPNEEINVFVSAIEEIANDLRKANSVARGDPSMVDLSDTDRRGWQKDRRHFQHSTDTRLGGFRRVSDTGRRKDDAPFNRLPHRSEPVLKERRDLSVHCRRQFCNWAKAQESTFLRQSRMGRRRSDQTAWDTLPVDRRHGISDRRSFNWDGETQHIYGSNRRDVTSRRATDETWLNLPYRQQRRGPTLQRRRVNYKPFGVEKRGTLSSGRRATDGCWAWLPTITETIEVNGRSIEQKRVGPTDRRKVNYPIDHAGRRATSGRRSRDVHYGNHGWDVKERKS